MVAWIMVAGLALQQPTAQQPGKPEPSTKTSERPLGGPPTLRILDARDFEIALRRAAFDEQPIVVQGEAISPFGSRRTKEASSEPSVEALLSMVGVEGKPLASGVYGVIGTPEQQEVVARIMDQVRHANAGSYIVRVTVGEAPDNAEIGTTAAPAAGGVQFAQAMRRGVPAHVKCTTAASYISDWTPVVADNSVGYDPQVSIAEDGFVADVTATPSREGFVLLSLTGMLSKVDEIKEATVALSNDSKTGLRLQLPTMQSRGVEATMEVPLGGSGVGTMVALAPGFGGSQPARSVGVWVSVRELPGAEKK